MIEKQLRAYQPINEQEAFDQKAMLAFIKTNPDYLYRSNLIAHFTVSTLVINEAKDHILFGFHNIYQSWGWFGGHNDGDPNLLRVAIKETEEETGLKHIRPYSKDIFMLDTIYVPNHIKHGRHVSDHLHMNATFLMIANKDELLQMNPEEHSGIQWFSLQEVLNHVKEPRMIPIYQKGFTKITQLKK
jgi:8-oxo-dGTP pyrophosphatase MutT (NUDIX family)